MTVRGAFPFIEAMARLKHSLIGCLAAAALLLRPAAAEPPLVGVNLDANSDWMTAAPWVDVRHLLRRWGHVDRPWEEDPSLPLTAQGYPLQDAASLTYLKGYPDGTYHLSYEGTGTVSLSGAGRLVGVVRNARTTAFEVQVKRQGLEPLIVAITRVDPADPVRRLRLVAPGYPVDTDRVFTEVFLRRTAPFAVLRFSEWMRTNNSAVREWNDRARPDSFLSTGASGVAYEEMVALANTLKKDVWINVPDQASDGYARQLARFLRENLHPGATVRLEYSSELWNFGQMQAHRNRQAARANQALAAPEDFNRAGEQAAYRLKALADIFREEFGAQSGRIRPVLAGQCSDSSFLRAGLRFIRAKYGDPSRYFAELAVAPYVTGDLERLASPGLTLDRLFVELDRFLRDDLAAQVREHRRLAEEYGLGLVAYEGGQRLPGSLREALRRKAQSDPRMGRVVQGLLTVWRREGGGLFVHSPHIAPYTKWGSPGLLQEATDAGSTQWDALMQLLLPPGDASLDGRVDYSDFVLLRGHFGKGRCWEQGDFNRDGRVNGPDFRLLRPALGALTPVQAVEVGRFEAGVRMSSASRVFRPLATRLGPR